MYVCMYVCMYVSVYVCKFTSFQRVECLDRAP